MKLTEEYTTDFVEALSMNSIKTSSTAQGWCQKSSHRGAKASGRGLKSLVFKCSFDKFSPTITTNFLSCRKHVPDHPTCFGQEAIAPLNLRVATPLKEQYLRFQNIFHLKDTFLLFQSFILRTNMQFPTIIQLSLCVFITCF